MDRLARFVEQYGKIPLAWAGATSTQDYINWGDAMSPVMVALCSSRDVVRIPSASKTPRMAAVGTMGQNLKGGEAWVWGTGSSEHANPSAKPDERVPYRLPDGTTIHVAATRGRFSERLLAGDSGPGVYGDPVWLLPRFYYPAVEKKWKLGVIPHLSELADRDTAVAHPNPRFARYNVPASGDVRLISTVTAIGVEALKDRLDEILACERIVSASLHGMVIAETYGIPCLPWGSAKATGLAKVATDAANIDTRMLDLYSGLGLDGFHIYHQDRATPTDWGAVIAAIDKVWAPKSLDGDRLLDACPFSRPVQPPQIGTVFDMPLLQGLKLQHSVRDVLAEDAARTAA